MVPRRLYKKFEDPSFPMEIKYYQTRRIMPGYTNIHWHPEAEFLYIKQGSFAIYDEVQDYVIQTGQVCILPPGKVHGIRALQSVGEYWSICFSLELITLPENHFLRQQLVEPLRNGTLLVPPVPVLNERCLDALNTMVSQNSQAESFIAMMTLWIQVLPQCGRIPESTAMGRGHAAVEACIQYMRANYASKITLKELADYVHLQPNYLCAAFKSYSGQTVFAYLNWIRLEKAKEMLKKTRLPISQVAELCGFGNTTCFGKKFKANTGTTPTAFQKAYQE